VLRRKISAEEERPLKSISERIIVTADLHLHPGLTDHTTLAKFAEELSEEPKPDLFVLAGDLGAPGYFEAALDIMSTVPAGRRAVLAGNHDLWYDSDALYTSRSGHGNAHTSRLLFQKILPAAATAAGWVWLEGETLQIGGTAVIGTIGWYDYGAIPGRVSPKNMREYKTAVNNDARFMDADWDDLAFAEECRQRVEERLAEAQEDPGVHQIVVISHVPPFLELRVRHSHDQSQADAFFYNLGLGETIARFPKVREVIAGHTHRGREVFLKRTLRARVVPSDYGRPAWLRV
jgi:3',5'-cyclic AMP phosphodiesterase CpdA